MSSELSFERKVPTAVKLFEGLGAIGLGSPVTRLFVGFLLGSGVSYLFKSTAMFDELGARPLVFFTDDKQRGTYLPWYAPGLILGFIFAFLM